MQNFTNNFYPYLYIAKCDEFPSASEPVESILRCAAISKHQPSRRERETVAALSRTMNKTKQ